MNSSDVLARVVTAANDVLNVKSIQFVSKTKPVHMTVQVKETRDRIIVTRRIRVKSKYIKKIEIIDIPTDWDYRFLIDTLCVRWFWNT